MSAGLVVVIVFGMFFATILLGLLIAAWAFRSQEKKNPSARGGADLGPVAEYFSTSTRNKPSDDKRNY